MLTPHSLRTLVVIAPDIRSNSSLQIYTRLVRTPFYYGHTVTLVPAHAFFLTITCLIQTPSLRGNVLVLTVSLVRRIDFV